MTHTTVAMRRLYSEAGSVAVEPIGGWRSRLPDDWRDDLDRAKGEMIETIRPGDHLYADADGVVVIPAQGA